jgi:hypothetical protein
MNPKQLAQGPNDRLKLHASIAEWDFVPGGKHHEIYLGDPAGRRPKS